MIRLTVSSIIFLYALSSVIILLIIWIISGYRSVRHAAAKDVEFIWKCSVCSNTYVDSKHDDISVCALCGSYNKREKQEELT